MNDYHQRFRERFPREVELWPATMVAILAFIDEVAAERDRIHGVTFFRGAEAGEKKERAALIEKVREMKRATSNGATLDALDDLLIYLWSNNIPVHPKPQQDGENGLDAPHPESPKETECCQFCFKGGDYETRKCQDCPCHKRKECKNPGYDQSRNPLPCPDCARKECGRGYDNLYAR